MNDRAESFGAHLEGEQGAGHELLLEIPATVANGRKGGARCLGEPPGGVEVMKSESFP